MQTNLSQGRFRVSRITLLSGDEVQGVGQHLFKFEIASGDYASRAEL